MKKLLSRASISATALLVTSVTASAQSADEIVVIGYRYLSEDTSGVTNLPLPIEKVPQSISLISNDFVKAVDLKNMGQIAQYTPGAYFTGVIPAQGSGVTLRGFTTGYAINGLPISDTLVEPDSALVDRFEVVKGPSSVVYGAARPGGIINLALKDAALSTPSYVSALAGSWGRWRIEGQTAGALNASGSIRGIAVGAREEADSHVDYVQMDKSVAFGGLDFDLTDSVTAYVRGSFEELEHTGFIGVPPSPDGTPLALPRSFFVGNEDITTTISTKRVNAGLSWELSPVWSLDLMAMYQQVDREGQNVYVSDPLPNGNVFAESEYYPRWPVKDLNIGASTVLKLDTLGLTDSFISGAVRYEDYSYRLDDYYASGSTNLFDGQAAINAYFADFKDFRGSLSVIENRLRSLTASTQALVKVAKRVALLGGVSFARPTVENRVSASGTDPWRDYDPGDQYSYRGAINVEPTDGVNLYVSYSESFQPQRRIDINNNVLAPLAGTQYEVGAKFIPANARILLTAAVFELKQSNQEVFDRVGDDGFNRYKALGEVRHRGIELEATGQMTERWQVKGGVAVLDAEVTKDANSAMVGKTRPWIARTSASVYTNYDFDNGLSVGVGARHVDSVPTSYSGTTRALPPFTLVDAAIGYSLEQWRLQLNLKNLLDEKYLISSYQHSSYGYLYGEPRSITASVQKSF